MTASCQEIRNRLAQVLQDDVQQLLCAIELRLGVLGKHAAAKDYEAVERESREIRGLTKLTIERTRQLARDLST